MTSCAIIVSHFESLEFLRCCIRQIKKYKHDEVEQQIIVVDQSSPDTHIKIMDEYRNSGVAIIWTSELYSGFGIDHVIRYCGVQSEYVCQLHCDAFPIDKHWLYAPIKLIEEYEFSFVGQLQFICNGKEKIYPPHPFCAMAQCYNVARTETYKEMSLHAGFTRFHNRKESGFTFKNNDWAEWAKGDYAARGSDDDVVAFAWEDKYREHDKLGLAITGMIGLPDASFGRVIDDLVFHFGSANESLGVMDKMPPKYQEYYKRIQAGFDEKLLEEMLADVTPYKSGRTFWDGKLKVASAPTDELNEKIEKLKTK